MCTRLVGSIWILRTPAIEHRCTRLDVSVYYLLMRTYHPTQFLGVYRMSPYSCSGCLQEYATLLVFWVSTGICHPSRVLGIYRNMPLYILVSWWSMITAIRIGKFRRICRLHATVTLLRRHSIRVCRGTENGGKLKQICSDEVQVNYQKCVTK